MANVFSRNNIKIIGSGNPTILFGTDQSTWRHLIEPYKDKFCPAAMGNSHRPELGLEFANTLMNLRPDIALSACRGIFQSDHRQDLSKFKKPCLIIQATDDIAVPTQVGKYLQENIQGSTLVNVKAKGHFPQLSAPEEVKTAIDSFLEEL